MIKEEVEQYRNLVGFVYGLSSMPDEFKVISIISRIALKTNKDVFKVARQIIPVNINDECVKSIAIKCADYIIHYSDPELYPNFGLKTISQVKEDFLKMFDSEVSI